MQACFQILTYRTSLAHKCGSFRFAKPGSSIKILTTSKQATNFFLQRFYTLWKLCSSCSSPTFKKPCHYNTNKIKVEVWYWIRFCKKVPFWGIFIILLISFGKRIKIPIQLCKKMCIIPSKFWNIYKLFVISKVTISFSLQLCY